MQLRLNISQTQTQTLLLTPQMQQVIEMMQYTQAEIEQMLELELSENPALQPLLEEEKDDKGAEGPEQKEAESSDELDDQIDWKSLLENAKEGYERSFSPSSVWDDLPPIEQNHSVDSTLIDVLLEQLGFSYGPEDELRAAESVILNLDERGYLDCSYEEICEQAEVDMDAVEGAILLVRELEPVGCGARNLKECLCFQAELLFPEDPFFVPLLQAHLEKFKPMYFGEIAEEMDMDPEDVAEYHSMMLDSFETEPGRPYASSNAIAIKPDVEIVKRNEDWVVLSTDNGNPKLRLAAIYERLTREKSESEDQAFLDKAMKKARYLVENIYRRENTMKRVMESLVQYQIAYFEYGEDFLRPLVLRDVAEDTGLHESTVSRLTSGKYMQTPSGLFEIRLLFQTGIKTIHGGTVASDVVKRKVERFIQNENPKKPLSDSAIAKRLLEDGIKLARRTVSKYREELRIPSSQERRLR